MTSGSRPARRRCALRSNHADAPVSSLSGQYAPCRGEARAARHRSVHHDLATSGVEVTHDGSPNVHVAAATTLSPAMAPVTSTRPPAMTTSPLTGCDSRTPTPRRTSLAPCALARVRSRRTATRCGTNERARHRQEPAPDGRASLTVLTCSRHHCSMTFGVPGRWKLAIDVPRPIGQRAPRSWAER